jgi:hypothetical protein
LVLIAAIFLYGTGVFDLIRLAVAAGAHLIIGWIYLIASPLCCPPYVAAASLSKNPFAAGTQGAEQVKADKPGTGANAPDQGT